MKHSTPSPSKADLKRFDKLYGIGCVACWLEGRFRYPEIHHLNLGGKAGQKRRGHEYTIPLCSWHHTGRIDDHMTALEMREKYGPSLARESRIFRHKYGTDDELLALVKWIMEEGNGELAKSQT